jgi:3-(3-hydroxy-phenyl)propionate hydroxylase
MSFDTDVLIIGAGPVGMTLANELTRHGVSPRIVDRATGIREVSKAMILHVRTQEVLDKVGIAERALREAQPLTEVVVHAYGRHIGSWDLDDIDSPYKHPLIIGQNRTQHALLDLLQSRGVDVEWGQEATALTLDEAGATTGITGGDGTKTTIRSRYVVGCEGSNSLVRRALNLSFAGERYSGEQFIQADCRIKWALPKGRSYLFLTAVGYMMVIEFPDDIVRVFISLPDEAADSAGAREAAAQPGAVESATEQPTLDEIHHHLTRLSGYECELSDAGWLARYRTSHRYADRFSQGRAFIAGDAAHVHVPIGGQGMNTGIQDAFNLGWKLAGVCRGELRQNLLDSYHDERHPVAESLIRGTNFAYTGILHPSEARQRAVRLFGPFLIRSGRVQDFMRNTLEELQIFYHQSPLNLDLGGVSGPGPGERVLDVDLVRADDWRRVTLNELTRGEAWTLLLFSGIHGLDTAHDLKAMASELAKLAGSRIRPCYIIADRKPPPMLHPADVLLDALHMAHGRYGVTSASFYLLRPDTYVAARGPLAAGSKLAPHLKSVFA